MGDPAQDAAGSPSITFHPHHLPDQEDIPQHSMQSQLCSMDLNVGGLLSWAGWAVPLCSISWGSWMALSRSGAVSTKDAILGAGHDGTETLIIMRLRTPSE